MSYVDLNPVRAGIANTPEDSDHTAIQARIRAHRTPFVIPHTREYTAVRLMLFQAPGNTSSDHLPFAWLDYLELMDWTGRAVLEHKRGAIPAHTPPVLTRLGIHPEAYLNTMRRGGNRFGIAMGRVDAMREAAKALEQRCLRGIGEARRLFQLPTG